jgi:hypothetical protein
VNASTDPHSHLTPSEQKKKKKGTDIETKSVDSIEHHGFQFPHPICGPGVSYGRSPLHKAVCEMDMGSVHQELSDSIGAACLHRKDEIGFNPIHSACALSMLDPENSPMACEITRLLINAGGEVSVVDGCKNTPLHWAARAGDADVVKLLLMKNCPPGKFLVAHLAKSSHEALLRVGKKMHKMKTATPRFTGPCELDGEE